MHIIFCVVDDNNYERANKNVLIYNRPTAVVHYPKKSSAFYQDFRSAGNNNITSVVRGFSLSLSGMMNPSAWRV